MHRLIANRAGGEKKKRKKTKEGERDSGITIKHKVPMGVWRGESVECFRCAGETDGKKKRDKSKSSKVKRSFSVDKIGSEGGRGGARETETLSETGQNIETANRRPNGKKKKKKKNRNGPGAQTTPSPLLPSAVH